MPEEQRTARLVTAVKTVADQTVRSMAQIALAWLRARPVPIIPMIGARELSQPHDNLGSFDLSLSADQMKAFDEAGRVGPWFPLRPLRQRSGSRSGLRRDARPDYRLGMARVSQLRSSHALRTNFIQRNLGARDFAKSLAARCHVTLSGVGRYCQTAHLLCRWVGGRACALARARV
jgi:aldo/keto reductase family protein